MKLITDANCAYSGCHDGAVGIGTGDFNDYSGFLPFLQNGSFRNRVISMKADALMGMPPDASAYPGVSQKDDLTEEELEVIQCWLDDGFLEN